MKRYRPYGFWIGLGFLLIIIGNLGDDALLWLLQLFNLIEMPYIREYLLLVSLLLLLASFMSIMRIIGRSLDGKSLLYILIGAITGGFGSICLMMVFTLLKL